jgi:hypothetical protein
LELNPSHPTGYFGKYTVFKKQGKTEISQVYEYTSMILSLGIPKVPVFIGRNVPDTVKVAIHVYVISRKFESLRKHLLELEERYERGDIE